MLAISQYPSVDLYVLYADLSDVRKNLWCADVVRLGESGLYTLVRLDQLTA